MEIYKKYKSYLIGAFLIALFLITRLYGILSVPIFTDEAIYIRWAQIAGTDSNWRFISLTDGKQPLIIWFFAAVMRFVEDPLLAGRLVSVGAGFATAVGLHFLTFELFRSRKAAFIASFLYVIYPFALVYDKLALYDSLVGTFAVWGLYFEILLVRKRRLDLAFITAMIIGGGLLTKSSALFSLYLLPFSLLLFDLKQKKLKHEFLKWCLLSVVVLVFSILYYSILRLSPFFYIIDEKNAVFVYPFSEWIKHPFTFFFGNMRGLLGWFVDYATIPLIVLMVSAFFINYKLTREKLLLLSWFVIPLIALALFGKVIYPRYILFMTLSLLPLAAVSLDYLTQKIKNGYVKVLIFLVFVFSMVLNDYKILNDFSTASIPPADREQLIAGWPAGVGIKETVKFLEDKAKNEKIYVGTEGTFGLMPYSLEIYLQKNPNIKTQGYWPIEDAPPADLLDLAKRMPTYFVFYQPCPSCPQSGVAPSLWPVKEVFQIKKLHPDTYYTLYEIKNP